MQFYEILMIMMIFQFGEYGDDFLLTNSFDQ